MVSSLTLTYMHLRHEELFGGDEWFGCKNIPGHPPLPSSDLRNLITSWFTLSFLYTLGRPDILGQ